MDRKFSDLNVHSVAMWQENTDYFQNKVPEIHGFLNRHYDKKTNIFRHELQDIFNNGPQSISNDMTIFLMNLLLRDNRRSDLAFKFDIWCPTEYMKSYIDHVFFEWYLGGFYHKAKIVDIVTGYYDPHLKYNKNDVLPLFGG